FDQGRGHLVERAVTTSGDDARVTGPQSLHHQTPGIAGLPGDAHRQLPALLTARLDGRADRLVLRLLAMQDHPRPPVHAPVPLARPGMGAALRPLVRQALRGRLAMLWRSIQRPEEAR